MVPRLSMLLKKDGRNPELSERNVNEILIDSIKIQIIHNDIPALGQLLGKIEHPDFIMYFKYFKDAALNLTKLVKIAIFWPYLLPS